MVTKYRLRSVDKFTPAIVFMSLSHVFIDNWLMNNEQKELSHHYHSNASFVLTITMSGKPIVVTAIKARLSLAHFLYLLGCPIFQFRLLIITI